MIKADAIICTDLRYPIEQEGLKQFCEANSIELIIIKIKNTGGLQRDDNISQREHESEYLVDQIKEDYLIEAKDIDELIQKITSLYDEKLRITDAT